MLNLKLMRRAAQVAAISFSLAFAGSALAEPADVFAKKKQDDITAMLNRKAPQADVNRAMGALFDYSTLVQRCWGAHWNDLNDGQKAEVTELMTKIVENNYESNLRKALKYETAIKSSKPEKEGEPVMRVHIRATDSTNTHAPPVNIEYVLRPEGDNWKIIDIVIEGSQLTHNYYTQIHRMMTNPDQKYTYVVGKLRERAKRSR